MKIDKGELDATEARSFFERYGMKLKLSTIYNPKTNRKTKKDHLSIIHTLVKACKGHSKEWPRLLSFALWLGRTTHSTITEYMLVELMLG